MTEETFNDPTQPGMFRPEAWNGHLLLIEARRYLENIATRFGTAPAVEARVHVLTANPIEVIEQARLFGAFESSTRDAIGGRPVIGRVQQFVGQSGGPAYRLDSASPEDKQFAAGYYQQWQAQHPPVQEPAQPTYPQVSYGQPTYTTPGLPPTAQEQMAPQYGVRVQPNAPLPQATPPAPTPTTAPVQQAAPQPQPAAPAPIQPQPQSSGQPAAPVAPLTPEQIAALPPEVRAMLLGGQQK